MLSQSLMFLQDGKRLASTLSDNMVCNMFINDEKMPIY